MAAVLAGEVVGELIVGDSSCSGVRCFFAGGCSLQSWSNVDSQAADVHVGCDENMSSLFSSVASQAAGGNFGTISISFPSLQLRSTILVILLLLMSTVLVMLLLLTSTILMLLLLTSTILVMLLPLTSTILLMLLLLLTES